MTRAELLRWPSRPGNGLAPWYVVGWRVIWAPLVYGGLAVAWLGVLLSSGYHNARVFWRQALS